MELNQPTSVYEKYAETKVVLVHQQYNTVDSYAVPLGWKLLGFLAEINDVPFYSNGISSLQRTTLYYAVLGKMKDEVLEESYAKVKKLETEVKELGLKAAALIEDHNRATSELVKATANVETLTTRNASLTHGSQEYRTRLQKMESDLGKLRDVLGRKQVDSILSGE